MSDIVEHIDMVAAANSKMAEHVAQIASAYFSRNRIAVENIPSVMAAIKRGYVHALADTVPGRAIIPQRPAIDPKHSVTDEYLVCLECGDKKKSLKRHLMASHGLTPAEYRDKWNLPHDYPMTAPGYAATRSEIAKDAGLGRKGATDGNRT